ncbi:mate-domain-containing protein [Apiospora rasikravindrae]|uniref:Mate-domain-containing protein n=1 Tax=Apiospora rasikravindrae TaxID=990691 RepID=A0ABR1TDY5_9PEZI
MPLETANGRRSEPDRNNRQLHSPAETDALLPPSSSSPPDHDHDHVLAEAETSTSELWILLQYSVPLIGTYLLQYSQTVITTAVAGHLSAGDLAATSIGLTTLNIVGLATFEGMATALDTLCAQAYGSGNLKGVGLHIQRMLLLMLAALVPIGAFWLASPWILTLFVKQPELAAKAGAFLQVSLIGLPGYASFEALKRFLQAQGDCNAALVVLVVCTGVNALLSWLFAFQLGLGLEGAALGQALTNDLRPVLLLAYIASPWGRWSHACWGGFSRDAFRKWGPMTRLSLAGSVVNLGEWFAFEIMTFSTSYISTAHLAAQTVLSTVSVITWHIPFSVSVAISTRVGHLIGAGQVEAARRAAVLYAAVFLAIGVFDGALMFALRNRLPRFFSEDAEVCAIAARSILAVVAFQVVDSVACGCNGMLRGLGRQGVAGWVVFPVNYVAAVPLAVWLSLGAPGLELVGVWVGLGVGVAAIAVIELVYMRMIRWESCVESAKSREES